MNSKKSVSEFQNELLKSLQFEKKSIFYLSDIFAIFPFNCDGECEIRTRSLIRSVIFLLIVLVFYFSQIYQIFVKEQSKLQVVLYITKATLNILLSTVCIVMPIVNRRIVSSIIENFSKISVIINQTRIDSQFKRVHFRHTRKILFTLSTWIIFILAFIEACKENLFPSFGEIEFYILPCTWLIVFQIDFWLSYLQEGFRLVNLQLEDFLQKNDSSRIVYVRSSFKPKLNIFQLNKINYIHFLLYKISGKINNFYAVQILIMVPRIITFCVLPVYFNILVTLVKDSNKNSPQIRTRIFTLSYIALLITPIIYVVRVSNNTVNEAKKIDILIHDLIDEDPEENVANELLDLSIQLLHRKIDFSIHEFFSLKPSLVTTVFELIITYVIILLQFQDNFASTSTIRLLIQPVNLLNTSFSNNYDGLVNKTK